jgi:thioredoxin-dependent peroxiredoxin
MNNGIIRSIESFFKPYESEAPMKHLTVGEPAPDFSAKIENGDIVHLNDFRGRKLALFFYPADNTPTCTKEACNLRDFYGELKAQGIEVLGISPDTEKKHVGFIKKFSLPYSLISDEEQVMMKLYGVWGEKKFMGKTFDGVHRTTFLIDEEGIIQHIFDKVDSANHAAQLLSVL